MSKAIRLRVFIVSLLSVLGALTSSAGAITWHNSGATTFTGTGNGATFETTGLQLSCTGSDVTGTVPATTSGALFRSSGTLTFTGCTAAGSPATSECSYTLTGTMQDGTGMGSVITGFMDVTCNTYISNTPFCHTAGTVSGSYSNTVPAAVTSSTGGSLIVRGANCVGGTGDLIHLSPRTITSKSTNPPTITRTAA